MDKTKKEMERWVELFTEYRDMEFQTEGPSLGLMGTRYLVGRDTHIKANVKSLDAARKVWERGDAVYEIIATTGNPDALKPNRHLLAGAISQKLVHGCQILVEQGKYPTHKTCVRDVLERGEVIAELIELDRVERMHEEKLKRERSHPGVIPVDLR